MRRHLRRVRNIGMRRIVAGAIVVVIGLVASVSGYVASKQTTNQQSYFGDFDNPDRVEVTAWISRIDTSTQTLSVTLMETRAFGAFAVGSSGSFVGDAVMSTNAVGTWRTTIKAGDSAPDVEQRITADGSFTNYPFDRYTADIEVHVASADGAELPVALTLYNTDPFFQVSPSLGRSPDGTGTVVNLDVRRSTPTLVFAVFIMVLMLGLAAAAAVAAYYVLHWKRGLIFPACSMMAAILFALIPLRNAVPGGPPIGSIIDFGSFFIAEAVISISLISGILLGFRHQLAIERDESPADDPPTPTERI